MPWRGRWRLLLAQRGGGAVSTLAEIPFRFRIENVLVSYVEYILQFCWPARLAVLYPYATDLSAWQVMGSAVALVLLTALAIRERKRRPYLAVGWLWFAGTLVPVIGLVQVGIQSRADRYMYMPVVGLAIMAVFGLAEIGERYTSARPILAAVAGVVCCVYAAIAWSTASYWRDTAVLFGQPRSR